MLLLYSLSGPWRTQSETMRPMIDAGRNLAAGPAPSGIVPDISEHEPTSFSAAWRNDVGWTTVGAFESRARRMSALARSRTHRRAGKRSEQVSVRESPGQSLSDTLAIDTGIDSNRAAEPGCLPGLRS